jgi:NAD(P)-dependent dehydrogenase (short-subunit alcohol dehydrogenase family)
MAGLLQGKCTLITGAGTAIGRGAALCFARHGAKVAVADVVAETGEETVRLIKAEGGEALFIKCNVAVAAEVKAMVERVAAVFGRLDCAFNNAGVETALLKLADDTEENFDRLVAINLKGVWLGMKYEIKQMLAQGGGGTIVNTASTAGLVGTDLHAIYCATKHGVIGLTKTGAIEYAKDGIRINAVCPGGTETPMLQRLIPELKQRGRVMGRMTPLARTARPEEMGEAAAWLCSDRASFVTGLSLVADGGLTVQ